MHVSYIDWEETLVETESCFIACGKCQGYVGLILENKEIAVRHNL